MSFEVSTECGGTTRALQCFGVNSPPVKHIVLRNIVFVCVLSLPLPGDSYSVLSSHGTKVVLRLLTVDFNLPLNVSIHPLDWLGFVEHLGFYGDEHVSQCRCR